MRIQNIDIIDEEHSVKGFDEELYLYPPLLELCNLLGRGDHVPRNMLPSTRRIPNSPAHMFSAMIYLVGDLLIRNKDNAPARIELQSQSIPFSQPVLRPENEHCAAL